MNQKTELTKITKNDIQGLIAVIDKVALNPDVDVDKMERLFELQERILDREAKQQYAVSMAAVQSETPRIIKDKRNAQTNSNYTSHEALVAAIKPLYTKNGFSLEFDTDVSPIEGHIRILCEVSHVGGYIKNFKADLPIDDKGIKGITNKTGTHASASTFSYGRRYLTLMIFNVATGDDTDGNAPTDPITEEQKTDIDNRLSGKTVDRSKFMKWLEKSTGATTLETIPAAKLSMVLRMIESAK